MTKCIQDAERILKRPITASEKSRIDRVVQSVITKDFEIDGLDKALRRAIDENMDEVMTEAMVSKRNAYLNEKGQKYLLDKVDRYDGPAGDAIEADMVGKQGVQVGTRDHLDATMNALTDGWTDRLLVDVERLGHGTRDAMRRGDLDTDVREAIRRMDANRPLDDIKPGAIKVAEIIRNHNEMLRINSNQAGANIHKRQGRATTQSHDMTKIKRAGPKKWKAFMRGEEGIDWSESYPGKTHVEQDAILSELYNRLSTGQHIKLEGEATLGLRGSKNIGRSMSHERSIVLKSAKGETLYNQQFGKGTLMESIIRNTETMAQNIAIMRRYGPNADMNVNRVLDVIGERLQKSTEEGSELAVAEFGKKVDYIRTILWPTVNGTSQIPGNAIAAQWWANIRAIKSMSSLGRAVVRSISDVSSAASLYRFQGGNYLVGVAKQVGGAFEGLGDIEKRELLAALSVTIDGYRAHITQRLDPNAGVSGWVSTAQTHYYKWNFLTPWTDRQSATLALSTAARLTTHSGSKLAELPEQWRRILKTYDIDDAKWNAMRGSKLAEYDGQRFITGEAMNNVSDDAIDAILRAEGKRITNRSRADARIALGDKVRSFYQDQTTQGVIRPGAKSRATLLRGTRPGDVVGELFRNIMQFKMFPTGLTQGTLAREIYGYGPNQRLNQVMGLSQFLGGNIALGYLSMSLIDLSMGKEPRWPDDAGEGARIMLASLISGGGMAFYADILFGEMKKEYGRGPIDAAAGPVIGEAANIVDLWHRMIAGDDLAAGTVRTLINNTPGQNLFYTKWILDYVLIYRLQEMMNPGYLRRMERRIKKEDDVEYLYPPSQTVR